VRKEPFRAALRNAPPAVFLRPMRRTGARCNQRTPEDTQLLLKEDPEEPHVGEGTGCREKCGRCRESLSKHHSRAGERCSRPGC